MSEEILQKKFEFTDADFSAIRSLIGDRTGINLRDSRRSLVYARLGRRLRALELTRFSEYIDYLDQSTDEVEQFVNSITTNLTSFFRESFQLDEFAQRLLPEAIEAHAADRRLRVWSAGCSTGEEPYTLAILVHEVLGDLSEWDVKILATDLDTQVLEKARKGTYPGESIDGMGAARAKRWFSRASGMVSDEVQIAPELQKIVSFKELNFMEDWPFRGPFDIIFCRNVLIYFDNPTQMWVIDRFGEMLNEGGHLVIGHSETLRGRRSDQFQACGKNVYRRTGASKLEASGSSAHQQPRPLHGFDHLDHYWDAELEHYATKIDTGQYYVTRDDEAIVTVVGCCVCVCVRDPVAQVGGMNHFLLPLSAAGELDSSASSYGIFAMEELINGVLKFSRQKHRLEVKLFGGAGLSVALRGVGEANVDFLKRFLVEERISSHGGDLGGNQIRKVCYFPMSGRVQLKRLDPAGNPKVETREQKFLADLRTSRVSGDIEFF